MLPLFIVVFFGDMDSMRALVTQTEEKQLTAEDRRRGRRRREAPGKEEVSSLKKALLATVEAGPEKIPPGVDGFLMRRVDELIVREMRRRKESGEGKLLPGVLRDALDRGIVSDLGIALDAIQQLPFKDSFNAYFETEDLELIHALHSGLSKLERGERPDKEEFLIIACPPRPLNDVALGLRDAAACSDHVARSDRRRVQAIAQQLDDLAEQVKPWDGWIREWAEVQADLLDEEFCPSPA